MSRATLMRHKKSELIDEVIALRRQVSALEAAKHGPVITGAATDITERKRAEDELAEKSAILEATLAHMDQGITMFDGDLKLTAFNRQVVELLEMPADLVRSGVSLADIFRYNAERGEYGPGDADQQVAERMAVARRFEAHRFERTRPDGMVIEVRGIPIPGGGFVTTYSDITERKQAEEELHNISETAYDAIVTINSESEVLSWNAATTRIFGHTAEDAIGRHIGMIIPNHFRQAHDEGVARINGGGDGRILGEAVEVEDLRINGEIFPVEMSLATWIGENGRTYSGILRDITDRKLAEEELRLARDQAEAASRSIGADALADLCLVLETAGKAGDWPVIEDAAPRLRGHMQRVADYIVERL